MFGSRVGERVDDLVNRHTQLENVVMINLPRLYKLEQEMSNISQRMESSDMHMSRLLEKERRADQHEQPSMMGTLPQPSTPTSGLAEGAPLFDDRPTSQRPDRQLARLNLLEQVTAKRYGSGATVKDPFDPTFPDPIHGETPQEDRWGQSLL